MPNDVRAVEPTPSASRERPKVEPPMPTRDPGFAATLRATLQSQGGCGAAAGSRAVATPSGAAVGGSTMAAAAGYLATANVQKTYWLPGRLYPRTGEGGATTSSVAGLSADAPVHDSGAAGVGRVGLGPESATRLATGAPGAALPLHAYPRPAQDKGWGIHWIPTVSSERDTVDRFIGELEEMGITWVTFLNEGTHVGANDYLVRRLVDSGMMPVMRIYTPGLVPLDGDLEALVRHYRGLGVSYFQLYNEPNLAFESGGQDPCVDRYLDLWVPLARRVIEAGGYPGFGALSPSGEMDDRVFLARAIDRLRERGEADVLDRAWLSMHNYAGGRPIDDPDGFLRFRQYGEIMSSRLGRALPIIGTEAGTYVTDGVDEKTQTGLVADAYQYMAQRSEPYCLAYSYWVVANRAGGGHDSSWEWQALFGEDNRASPIVDALKRLAERT